MNNLLVNLRKWVHRQDENFTTEALAHVLRHLGNKEPVVAARILTKMTRNIVTLTPEEANQAQIATQVTTPEGRPDIEIRCPRCLIYIEAKVGAGLGPDQLEGYRRDLDRAQKAREAAQTALVLLTRSRYPPPDVGVSPYHAAIRWLDIAEWLSEELRQAIQEPVSEFLVRQLVEYLKGRRMTVELVTRELGSGTRSLNNLLVMLEEVAQACDLACDRRKIRHLWDEHYYFGCWLADKRYWIGVSVDDPDNVLFFTHKIRIDPEIDKKLNDGGVSSNKWATGGFEWSCWLELTSEAVHFFTLSLAGQKECLEQFLKRCVEAATRFTIPEPGGAIPQTTEEMEQDAEEDETEESHS